MEDLRAQLAAAYKRQRASVKRTGETLDGLLTAVRAAKAATGGDGGGGARDALRRGFGALAADPLAAVREEHKAVYGALTRVGRALEKELDAGDLDALCPPGLQLDSPRALTGLASAIVDRLTRQGHAGAASAVAAATGARVPVVRVTGMRSTVVQSGGLVAATTATGTGENTLVENKTAQATAISAPIATQPTLYSAIPLGELLAPLIAEAARIRAGCVGGALAQLQELRLPRFGSSAVAGLPAAAASAAAELEDRYLALQLHLVHVAELAAGRLWTPSSTTGPAPAQGEPLRLDPATAATAALSYARHQLRPLAAAPAQVRDPCSGAATYPHLRLCGQALGELVARLGSGAGAAVGGLAVTGTVAGGWGSGVFSPAAREAAARAYIAARCATWGVTTDAPPLDRLVEAGSAAAPALLRFHALLGASALQQQQQGPGATVAEIPVDVPLPPGLRVHAVFVDPVARQAVDPAANPPQLLACGHVIARETVERLTAGGRPRFKCPTCPALQMAGQALPLVLE